VGAVQGGWARGCARTWKRIPVGGCTHSRAPSEEGGRTWNPNRSSTTACMRASFGVKLRAGPQGVEGKGDAGQDRGAAPQKGGGGAQMHISVGAGGGEQSERAGLARERVQKGHWG